MSGSVNKVILVGNLGRDPEIRNSREGKKIANFSIATSESWRDKQTGERREKTEWHRVVVVQEGLAKVVEQYVQKGTKLYVEGKLQTREWEDQQGQKRFTTEILVDGFSGAITILGGGMGREGSGEDHGDRGGSSRSSGTSRSGSTTGGRGDGGGQTAPIDDEIPF